MNENKGRATDEGTLTDLGNMVKFVVGVEADNICSW